MPQPVEHAKKIDVLADRFEKEWKAGRKAPIERILARADDSGRSVLLQALVEVEIKLRRQKGEQPTPTEYRARFPKDPIIIQAAFDGPSKRLKAASQDTSVSKDSVKTGTYGGHPPAAPTSGKLPATSGRFQVDYSKEPRPPFAFLSKSLRPGTVMLRSPPSLQLIRFPRGIYGCWKETHRNSVLFRAGNRWPMRRAEAFCVD